MERGENAVFSAEAEEENEPGEAEKWGEERTIKAERIAWLCTNPQALAWVTYRGIMVTGVLLEGELDLQFARISFPVHFEKSAIPKGINLQISKIQNLNLSGTYTGPISADGLRVEGNVFLRNGFKSEGEVRLIGATITGNLFCENGRFINREAIALSVDGIKVEGSVFLCNGFQAEGQVRLLNAIIKGQLNCEGGNFTQPKDEKIAFHADGIKVEDSVLLRNGFKATGEVRLGKAEINGDLDCDNGQFSNTREHAISADGFKVKGSLFMRKAFKADGEVRLLGAEISGQLNCTGGKFINNGEGKIALGADGVKVEDSVFLRDVHAEGKVSMVGAIINRAFIWTGVTTATTVSLDLRSAKIGTLFDDGNSWPKKGDLFLHGLVYDEDAKQILIVKNIDRARLTKLSWSEKFWYLFFGKSIGYGYRPWRAFWLGLVFVAIGCVLFEIGYKANVMMPTQAEAYKNGFNGKDHQVSENYPKFCAIVYSLDMFVPLVNLKQTNYWLPNANRKGEMRVLNKYDLSISGGCLCFYMWIHIIMGWILTTLFVVALTGVIRS